MAVFMPVHVLERYPSADDQGRSDVGQGAITLILVAQPISALLAAPVIGIMMGYYGRKNMLLFSMIILFVSTLIAAGASIFDSPSVFVLIAVISRLLQGVGAAANFNVVFAIIADK